MQKQELHLSGWMMVSKKSGYPQGLDHHSGGYPYDVNNLKDIYVSGEQSIKDWTLVMNNHGKRDTYEAVEVEIIASWDVS